MEIAEFRGTLSAAEPPDGLSPCLRAMWFAATGDWAQAHGIAQTQTDARGAWVHAYLHRVEGDYGNAGYWYRRAGQPVGAGPLDDEWTEIATALLAAGD